MRLWCTNPLIILDLDPLSEICINNNMEEVFSLTLSLDVLRRFEIGETHWLANDFKFTDEKHLNLLSQTNSILDKVQDQQ